MQKSLVDGARRQDVLFIYGSHRRFEFTYVIKLCGVNRFFGYSLNYRVSLQEYLEILADMPLKHESNENSDDCDSNQKLCDEMFEGDDHVFEDPELEPLQCSFRAQDNGIEESDV